MNEDARKPAAAGKPHARPTPAKPERLQKILSAAGVASRRLSEQLISDGRVSVNGSTITELGTKADPARDEIRVDGRRIQKTPRPRYILLYKPRGYVTTRSDPQKRPTVIDLMSAIKEYIYPVGRLDYDSEGLLLLTNDGDLAAHLTHPRHEVERVYQARVRGVPDAHDVQRLQKGMVVDGRRTTQARVTLEEALEAPSGPQALLLLSIREGRNRQVRKMFDAVGHPVMRLRRIRIGPIQDDALKPGHYRELTPGEVTKLRRAAGL